MWPAPRTGCGLGDQPAIVSSGFTQRYWWLGCWQLHSQSCTWARTFLDPIGHVQTEPGVYNNHLSHSAVGWKEDSQHELRLVTVIVYGPKALGHWKDCLLPNRGYSRPSLLMASGDCLHLAVAVWVGGEVVRESLLGVRAGSRSRWHFPNSLFSLCPGGVKGALCFLLFSGS